VHVSITKQKIIQSITQLCHSLEIRVVAEGIECPEERDALALLGVDLMQGYYFARPGRPMPEVTW
jgi:EAL domain-containing protein (putative c-di-GMP-specific phosphodiesterase class I)